MSDFWSVSISICVRFGFVLGQGDLHSFEVGGDLSSLRPSKTKETNDDKKNGFDIWKPLGLGVFDRNPWICVSV